MRVYFDTSVLVPALVVNHPHHAAAIALLVSAKSKSVTGFMSAHGITELYSVLTRAPFTPPVYPSEARQMIEQTILPLVGLVALSATEYRHVIAECADAGWTGGTIHDAVHIRAARKAECERLYTFNVKHFRALAPDLHGRISAP